MNFLGFCQELQYLFKKSQKDKKVLEKLDEKLSYRFDLKKNLITKQII